ncbi:MAG: PIN domain-containing protein [Stenomitos frigidus ULC029]
MSNKPYFLDSNVWLYRLLDDQSLEAQEPERKRTIASTLTAAQDIITSTQVINEVCANALRKAAFTEAQIQTLIASFQSCCLVVTPNIKTLTTASRLRSRYHFSFWDGLIVASALSANADILYSEDMQDGLVGEQQLTIVNPFK